MNTANFRGDDQTFQLFGGATRLKHMQSFGGKVTNARVETIPQQGGGGEDKVGEAPGIGAFSLDTFAG